MLSCSGYLWPGGFYDVAPRAWKTCSHWLPLQSADAAYEEKQREQDLLCFALLCFASCASFFFFFHYCAIRGTLLVDGEGESGGASSLLWTILWWTFELSFFLCFWSRSQLIDCYKSDQFLSSWPMRMEGGREWGKDGRTEERREQQEQQQQHSFTQQNVLLLLLISAGKTKKRISSCYVSG